MRATRQISKTKSDLRLTGFELFCANFLLHGCNITQKALAATQYPTPHPVREHSTPHGQLPDNRLSLVFFQCLYLIFQRINFFPQRLSVTQQVHHNWVNIHARTVAVLRPNLLTFIVQDIFVLLIVMLDVLRRKLSGSRYCQSAFQHALKQTGQRGYQPVHRWPDLQCRCVRTVAHPDKCDGTF